MIRVSLPRLLQGAFCDRSCKEPKADGVDARVAAVGEDSDADLMFGSEADPCAAVAAATVLVEDTAE
jgi:hypothetical protein